MNKKYIISGLLLVSLLLLIMFFWNKTTDKENYKQSEVDNKNYTTFAYFAGGCFWCVEKDFEKLDGVGDVISGYSGGNTENPTYKNHGDHREAVMVPYDPNIVTYEQLVQYYFRHSDGTDAEGSFFDRGRSYTSAISYQNDNEKEIATKVKMGLDQSGIFEKPLVTEIEPFINFIVAEEYHQNYYKRDKVSATKYKYYRAGSGRDDFIDAVAKREQALIDAGEIEMQDLPDLAGENNVWQSYEKPSDDVLKNTLTDTQYLVTQKEATERPFSEGNLDKENRDGIFVDILSGEPLYSSRDKFDSGTGWPSFTKPIGDEFIVTKNDYKLIFPRTEVRSKYGDNHIGHVFNDGPEPTGQRWCMNGAAMRFVPLADMVSEGYANYVDQVTEA